MDIKRRFPDEQALSDAIGAELPALTTKLRAELGADEAEYIAALRRRKKGLWNLGAGVVAFGILFGVGDSDVTLPAVIVMIMAPALIIAGIWFLWRGGKLLDGTTEIIKRFVVVLNASVFKAIFVIFGLRASHIAHTESKSTHKDSRHPFVRRLMANRSLTAKKSPEREQTLQLLEHSALITEPKNTITVDDMFTATISDRTLFWAELDVKNVTGSGKNRRVKKIFRGYFLSFDLPRPLEGKTFVSTEGDKRGFGHRSFFKFLTDQPRLEETELEWNDFENLLHLLSDNPTEARYILTPDFMHDLYDWWQLKNMNIRIAFHGQRMYVLYPDKKIRLGSTIARIESQELKQYMLSIANPLLHVLHLIEDVEERFRS